MGSEVPIVEKYTGLFVAGSLAVIFFGLGLPLALGKVKRNAYYGYRINSYTMENDDIWYAVNRAGGRDMVAGSAIFALIAAISLLYMDQRAWQAVLLVITALVAIVGGTWSVARAFRISYKMASDKGLR